MDYTKEPKTEPKVFVYSLDTQTLRKPPFTPLYNRITAQCVLQAYWTDRNQRVRSEVKTVIKEAQITRS